MSKKSTVLIISIVVLLSVLVCSWTHLYNRINKLYPRSNFINVNVGEEILYQNISIKGVSYDFLTYDELKKQLGDKMDYSEYETNFDINDLIFINVNVLLRNDSENDMLIPLYNTTISSMTYSNGIDMSTFTAINDGTNKLLPTLKPGESTEICFTYTMFRSVLNRNDDTVRLELIFQLYPDRISITLN